MIATQACFETPCAAQSPSWEARGHDCARSLLLPHAPAKGANAMRDAFRTTGFGFSTTGGINSKGRRLA